jgi:hypothetical protein
MPYISIIYRKRLIMKMLMIIMFVVIFCGSAMADVSNEMQNVYDDILVFLSFEDDESERGDATTLESVFNDTLDDLESTFSSVDTSVRADIDDFSESTSAVTNPEPCSIILSSIGLGAVAYLKRRRAI